MTQIIPAILATNESEFQDQINKVKDVAEFEWIQLDLMDNKFVQNKSIGIDIIAKYPTEKKLECHLMVEYPDTWIEELSVIPQVKRIIFPIEDPGTQERISLLKNLNIEVGLSLNPDTNIDQVQQYLSQLDLVLVMGVNPGFQGQEFIAETNEKIRHLSKLKAEESLSFAIEVDGGITLDNAKSILGSGAEYLVIGSHLVEGNIEENLEKFKAVING